MAAPLQLKDIVSAIVKNEDHASEIIKVIEEETLTLEQFLKLNDEDLKEIFKKMGTRKAAQELIEKMKSEVSVSESSFQDSGQNEQGRQQLQSMTTSQATVHSTVTQPQDTSQQEAHTIPEGEDHENRTATVFHRIGKPQGTAKDSAKILLLVGMTGVGKGTLVDALGNYLLGAKTPNPQSPSSHFRRASQTTKTSSESQTSGISVYRFEHQQQFPVPFPVTIIDTPGFADTGGLDQDIASHLKNLLTLHFDHLHAVILVVKASDARASAIQKYTLHGIQQLFGKDIKENIYVVATHADSPNIRALEGLKEVNFPFTIEKAFAVNNAVLDECSADDEDYIKLNDIIWKRNYTTYEKMLTSIASTPPATLQLTRETLLEQQGLTIAINNFNKHIYDGVLKISELKTTQGILNGEIDAKASVPKTVQREVPNTDNSKAFNCKTCKCTCQHPCTTYSLLDKIPWFGGSKMSQVYCQIVDQLNSTCSKCKCSYDDHSFDSIRYEVAVVETQETCDDILLDDNRKTAKLQQIQQELEVIRQENSHLLSEMKKRMDRLNVISLEQSQLTPANFINRLIQQEQSEPGQFSEERIQILQDIWQTAAKL